MRILNVRLILRDIPLKNCKARIAVKHDIQVRQYLIVHRAELSHIPCVLLAVLDAGL